MDACRHDDSYKYGRQPNGNQRWRCRDCGKGWSEAKPRRICRCELCEGEAVRLFLCGECWRRIPTGLVAAWLAVGAMGKGRIKSREKFAAAWAIIEWAKTQRQAR